MNPREGERYAKHIGRKVGKKKASNRPKNWTKGDAPRGKKNSAKRNRN